MDSADLPPSDITEAVQHTLEELGIHDTPRLQELFSQLANQLQKDMAQLAETGAGEPEKLEALRVRWLGRKQGVIRSINDNWLRSASPELKREIGQLLNALREEAERQILVVKRAEGIPMTPAPVTVTPAPVTARWSIPEPTVFVTGALDITLPGTRRAVGVRHILRRVMDEITEIFFSLGYSVEEGPDIESVYYNFEALNIPEDHPARDDQDTFYIDSQTVLRTHTSPVQIRTMEKLQPPLRIIVPGKAYRRDTPDATHSPMFHQVEGLAVDTHITFADLKGTLDYFLKEFFGPQVRTRFRPSFFPFTEPSAEVDISCLFCGAQGCRICKQSGWIELMGCGMVDPALYPHVHYDASRYSGFAFGMGVERLAMLKYGVQDIQLFFQGDVRFLHQFR